MKGEIIAYSSVKGKLHEKNNMPNQDAYCVKQYKFGTVLVVSDGLGSHLHSEIGSKGVCRAVCKAIQIWNQYTCKDVRLLIPLIHSLWGMEIFPSSKIECGATCLFAYISNEDKLYVGQLGDGNIYISVDEDIELLVDKEDEFSNYTSAMSSIKSFTEWHLKMYDLKGKSINLCLMTDGVSETLIEQKKLEFIRLLWKRSAEYDNLPQRNNWLCKLLTNWNDINSGDDRTLVSYERK